MSENLEFCPKCKQGHLRDAGGVTIKREIEPPLRQTGSIMRERICDQCGHRQIDQYLNEYGEPASDLLSGTVTKQNQGGVEEKLFTCDCGASFKTDQELHEHHQSEHGGPASDKITGTVTRIDPQDKTEE
jgi:hypothetical protein